jgi:hypothetical protein
MPPGEASRVHTLGVRFATSIKLLGFGLSILTASADEAQKEDET